MKLIRTAAMVILSFLIILPIVFDVNAEQNVESSEETTVSSEDTVVPVEETTPEEHTTVPEDNTTAATEESGSTGATSGTTGGASGSMDEINQEKEELISKKEEAQNLLDSLNEDRTDIVTSAQLIDEKITEYQEIISDIEKQEEELEKEIETQEKLLEEAKAEESKQYEAMKARIQFAYESGNYSYIDAFMNATKFSDVINHAEYVSQVSEYDANELYRLIEIREGVANKQQLLDLKSGNLEDLRAEYQEDTEALQILWEGKQTQIENYDKNITSMEEEIEKLDKDEEALDARIAALENQSNNVIIISGNFDGEFAWPMPMSTNITSYFGPRSRPTAGASSYHRGIDIACPQGSNVIASADGVVMYVGYMSSAGNAVLVNHGGGVVTCYYHLSAFNCSVGDSVVQGQVIAYSGNTGVSTGPHLHFSIRINGQYVDPLSYF